MNAIFSFIFGLTMIIRSLHFLGVIILLAVHILLNVILKDKSFIVLQIVYYSFSVLMFLQSFISAFAGAFSHNQDKLIRKYYCALKWPMGAEMYSWYCSTFTFHNFIYAIALCIKLGIWYPIVVSVIYFLIYNNILGPRLNPYLFLADRAKQGDINAAIDLQALNTIKLTGAGIQ